MSDVNTKVIDFAGTTGWFTEPTYSGAGTTDITGSTAEEVTTTTASTTTTPPDSGLSAGAIVGIVFGVLLFLALVVGAIFAFIWWKRKSQKDGGGGGRRPPGLEEIEVPQYDNPALIQDAEASGGTPITTTQNIVITETVDVDGDTIVPVEDPDHAIKEEYYDYPKPRETTNYYTEDRTDHPQTEELTDDEAEEREETYDYPPSNHPVPPPKEPITDRSDNVYGNVPLPPPKSHRLKPNHKYVNIVDQEKLNNEYSPVVNPPSVQVSNPKRDSIPDYINSEAFRGDEEEDIYTPSAEVLKNPWQLQQYQSGELSDVASQEDELDYENESEIQRLKKEQEPKYESKPTVPPKAATRKDRPFHNQLGDFESITIQMDNTGARVS